MIRQILLLIFLLVFSLACKTRRSSVSADTGSNKNLRVIQDKNTGAISVFRKDGTDTLLVQEAKQDQRPYITQYTHPMEKEYSHNTGPIIILIKQVFTGV